MGVQKSRVSKSKKNQKKIYYIVLIKKKYKIKKKNYNLFLKTYINTVNPYITYRFY
jgi:ribosomal protein L32